MKRNSFIERNSFIAGVLAVSILLTGCSNSTEELSTSRHDNKAAVENVKMQL